MLSNNTWINLTKKIKPMQTLFNHFSQVLGITLLHSLWQGLIIYVLLRVLLLCIPSASAGNKYNMALLSLAASVLWPLITLVVQISKHPFIPATVNIDAGPFTYIPILHNYPAEPLSTWSFAINNYMPYLVVLWFIGILLNSARLLWSWRNVYQIRQSLTNSQVLERSIKLISQMLHINKKVSVFLSEHVDVPCIIGYVNPVIILPAAVITQFSAEQIKSILVHEMAHIRRNDYFINIIQQVIGILFFFNPFTHLINRIIYTEREHCCDDLVLQITGQPLVYAQTLLKLEETRQRDWQLALAATGKKYHLLNRIKRIMETKKQVSNIRHILAAVLLLLGSMGTIAWLNPEIKDGKVTISPIKKFDFMLPGTDTVKAKTVLPKAKAATIAPKHKTVNPKLKKGPSASQFDYTNPTLDKLTADVDQHALELDKSFNSPEFKSMEAEIEKRSAAIDAFYKGPEIKKLQNSIDVQAKKITQIFDNNPSLKELDKK
jgi:bla regulator protein BlaR1